MVSRQYRLYLWVEALLTVVDKVRRPEEVYRKVGAVQLSALS